VRSRPIVQDPGMKPSLPSLVQRTLEGSRMLRLQRNLSDHVIVCGFGSTGASAADTVTEQDDRLLCIEFT